jgi:hypothetical protein
VLCMSVYGQHGTMETKNTLTEEETLRAMSYLRHEGILDPRSDPPSYRLLTRHEMTPEAQDTVAILLRDFLRLATQ